MIQHWQPIRIQTADRVENAILHIVESETASSSDIRVSAMHDHSPIHSMLFNNQGTLLTANKAALKALQVTFEGMPLTPNGSGADQQAALPCPRSTQLACAMMPGLLTQKAQVQWIWS